MTPEQKIIAIAKFEGIQKQKCSRIGGCFYELGISGPCKCDTDELETPPYLTSRDAICGAVARLPDWDENGKDKAEYSERLAYVVGANWSSNNVEDRRRIFEVTASQMANALLLTLGYEI